MVQREYGKLKSSPTPETSTTLLGELHTMINVLKEVEGWPFTFGGEEHSGWLPPGAAPAKSTLIERELLHVRIVQVDGGFLLMWAARPSATCQGSLPPKTGDTWHQAIEDAESAAREQFGIGYEHWKDKTGEQLA